MNLERVLAKLRRDNPLLLAGRVLDHWRFRCAGRRRRAFWQSGGPQVSPRDMPAGFSPSAATRLWPGAADRSWIDAARERWPVLYAEASRRAAAAAEGRFDLLGSGEVSAAGPDGRLRWHDDFKAGAAFPADCLYLDVPIWLEREGTDIKVPWELSRFQHVFAFLWTDPQRYRDVFLAQWEDWMRANPVARGVNWACTMDVALRAISWTAALAAWGNTFDEPTLRRMWAALAAHGHFVRDNLEWMSGARTNHYFSDIVGLAVLGAVLAPYPPAQEWSALAARELEREIAAQFAEDGFNKECSTTYHRLMVELATLGWLASRVGGYDLSRPARDRLLAAYGAIAILTDVHGQVPLIGDNDSGRVFPLAQRDDTQMGHLLSLGAAALDAAGGMAAALGSHEVVPEAYLLCGPTAVPQGHCSRAVAHGAVGGMAAALGGHVPDQRPMPAHPASGALHAAGLFVFGDQRDRMTVRCGPITYRPVGSHKHIDQLSIALTIGGRPILVDPGQFCYTPWPQQRNEFIVSRAHNTVVVDGQPQCRMFILGRMSFSIIDEARPECLECGVVAGGWRFVGRHRGYRRLPGGADHERTVVYQVAGRRWTVSDRLPLRGRHRVEWLFHLHPDVTATEQAGQWLLRHAGSTLSLRWLGETAPNGRVEPGWYAPAYGRKVPAGVLVFRIESVGPVQETFVLQAEEVQA